ncbi:CopG family ribbon-helix-helix protein [Gloeobacter morelensis]|uniref:Ribbon-helix-helix protein, CopG family n=1 Tax=Gloeobacter morelensis MG652769 TaxID=2781736 RepID=A0ABY3PHA1_9CYAN|nr:ribbon-helix-helix protein, CopG family [Gloeobacter morelensis]UFP93020.1 ribbon-helix-helix protein, CopG family [Gloeobacter morelensis MG652769]
MARPVSDRDMVTVSFRCEREVRDSLDEVAKLIERDRSWVINAAIEEYLARELSDLRSIARGLDQARRGELASDEQVKAAFDAFKPT